MNKFNFNSIFFGGAGINSPWSLGVALKLHELGFKDGIEKIGSLSSGCLPALAFIGAADFDNALIVTERVRNEKYYFSLTFRKKFKNYLQQLVKQTAYEDIKKSKIDLYLAYNSVSLDDVPRLRLFKDFEDREDLIQVCDAGCYIPIYFGLDTTQKYFVPRLRNGDYAIDAGISIKAFTHWDEYTLAVHPALPMNERTIGGNLGFISALGFAYPKLSTDDLFAMGYAAASAWHAKYHIREQIIKNADDLKKSVTDHVSVTHIVQAILDEILPTADSMRPPG